MAIDKEKRYSDNLQKCRDSINKTRELIAYHKEMLKKLEQKEVSILANLNNVKMSALFDMINQNGYDIDALRQAVSLGDFSVMSVPNSDMVISNDITDKKEPVQTEQTKEKTFIDERKN